MKHNPLTEQELQNLSQLLLSTDSANVEIGLQLAKNNKDYAALVSKELILISQLSWNDALRKSAHKLLKKVYAPEELAYWDEAFKIVHTYDNLYDYQDFENNWHLFEKHEAISPSFTPLIIQNNDYVAEYIILADCIASYYKKKLDWAERYYLLALERNPNDLGLLSTLGELYKDGFHNYTKALDCYDKMLRIDPLHYDAMEAKGLLLFNYLKDYTKAIEVLENALEHYPDDQNLQTWLADVYMTINTSEAFEKGKKILLEVLENAPTDSLALTIYANQLWITKNNPKEAQKIYLKILDASNHHYNALGNLAELYYLEFQEYNIAQEHYAKAFALYMDDIYHLCNYISLLTLELNELEDAKDYYQHLLTLCYKEIPREPEMRDEQWTRFKEAEKKLVVYITDSTN